MKKFVVSASVDGLFLPVYFSSRNAALRFIAKQSAFHGGDWFLNGRLRVTV